MTHLNRILANHNTLIPLPLPPRQPLPKILRNVRHHRVDEPQSGFERGVDRVLDGELGGGGGIVGGEGFGGFLQM